MRKRVFLISSGLAIIAAGVTLYKTLLDDLPTISHAAGDRRENIVEISGKDTAGQTFRPQEPNLSGVDLRVFGPQGIRLDGDVTLRIRRSPQETTNLRSSTLPAAKLLRGAHTRFSFPALDTTREDSLYLSIEYPTGARERPLQVRAELPLPSVGEERFSDYANGELHKNHQAVPGDLDFRLLTRSRRPFGTQVSAAAVLGGAYLLFFSLRPQVKNTWSFLVLGIGLPLIFLLPMLKHPSFLGTDDWDMNTTMHVAAERAINREHAFPGWNPYLCGGTPLAAFPESPVFSPFFSTVLLGGSVVGFKINVLLHVIIGFLGMLVWLRRGWRVSWTAAFLGASAVMFSSFVALHLGAGHTRKVAIAWIPWVLHFFQRAATESADGRRTPFRVTALAGTFLALMFLDGSVYLSLYTAAFLAIVSMWMAISARNVRPLAAGLMTLLIGALLAGMHLVPVLASQRSLHTTLDAAREPVPIRALIDIFLDPNQSPHAQKFDRQPLPWSEYGAYIGIALLVLAVAGTVPARPFFRPWLGTGAVFLLWAFVPAVQHALAAIPILGDLRNPQRMVVMVTVILGIAAALGFDRLTKWLQGNPPSHHSRAVQAALGILAALTIGHRIFINTDTLASTFPIPPPPVAEGPFRQGWARTRPVGEADTFTDTTENTFRNRGSLNRCSVASVHSSGSLRVFPEGLPSDTASEFYDEGYQGEAFLLEGRGEVTVESQKTSAVSVRYRTETPAVLALNQNFHPGWRVRVVPDAEASVRDSPATERTHLITTALAPGTGTVTFSYVPPGLGLGLLTSALGLVLALWVWRSPRHTAS